MHEILIGSFGSFLASLGFGVLFNIKQKRKLFLAGLNGAMGGFVYECCRAMLLTDLEANFWAAVSFTVTRGSAGPENEDAGYVVYRLRPDSAGAGRHDVRYDD